MHTREGTTLVTQQEKVKNETRQQMNNLFQRLSFRSFLLSRKHHYLFATGSFHFRTGQAKLSKAHFYLIHFLKVRHFMEKLITNRFLEFFLKLHSRCNRLSKRQFRKRRPKHEAPKSRKRSTQTSKTKHPKYKVQSTPSSTKIFKFYYCYCYTCLK